MGLDIMAYENAEKVTGDLCTSIMTDAKPTEAAYEHDCNIPWINTDFPGREDGMERAPYRAESNFNFWAGSYHGYNQWREQLARLIGIEDVRAWWQNPDMSLPFAALLNFADNEGTIGPVVSAKLASDFVEHDSRAVEFSNTFVDGEYWLERYRDWTKAFQMAANNGYVAFQ